MQERLHGLYDPSHFAAFLQKRAAEEAVGSEGGASEPVSRLEVAAPPSDALMESLQPLPVAAEGLHNLVGAGGDERCVRGSNEPQADPNTRGVAPHSGGVDLLMRESSVQLSSEHLQWEWEMFGPPPRPDDDGDLESDLEYEFENKCIITYP